MLKRLNVRDVTQPQNPELKRKCPLPRILVEQRQERILVSGLHKNLAVAAFRKDSSERGFSGGYVAFDYDKFRANGLGAHYWHGTSKAEEVVQVDRGVKKGTLERDVIAAKSGRVKCADQDASVLDALQWRRAASACCRHCHSQR